MFIEFATIEKEFIYLKNKLLKLKEKFELKLC